MELVNLPALRKRSLETLSHTGLSVAHAMRHRPDAAVLFNAGNAPIPVLKARGIPTAVHVDGLEWKRAKWQGAGAALLPLGRAGRRALWSALSSPTRRASPTTCRDLRRRQPRHPVRSSHPRPGHRPSRRARPGAGQLPPRRGSARAREPRRRDRRGLRREPARLPLVVVGSAPYGDDHIAEIRSAAGDLGHPLRRRRVGPGPAQPALRQLASYLHGHSVGGTNPSLLRALGCAAPVTALRRQLQPRGHRRARPVLPRPRLGGLRDPGRRRRPRGSPPPRPTGQEHAAATYRWDDVAERYLRMLTQIARR